MALRWLLRLGTILVSTGGMLLAGEIFIRVLDGYDPLSHRLVLTRQTADAPPAQPADAARQYVHATPLAPGMRHAWFDLSPVPLPRSPITPALREAAERLTPLGLGTATDNVFNFNYANEQLCRSSYYRKFPGFMFVFDAPAAAKHPAYRFPRDAISPTGLVTNRFGWRGPQIERTKPPRTIRIAFVGASTTINRPEFPFSYPELTVFWLNHWAQQDGIDVRFEVINAGRAGINSTDIAAIVRDELLPVRPDIVVYYEGANNVLRSVNRRVGMRFIVAVLQDPRIVLTALQEYSAAARRLQDLLASSRMAEPAKPPHTFVWPADVDPQDPPLRHASLPAELSTVVADLDDIRTRVERSGGQFVLSTFFWLVSDGLTLDKVRHRGVYDYLNQLFFPYPYRELEKIVSFENRLFRKYAHTHQLGLIDVAAVMPGDPDLFEDAIHARYDGIRLHAWIAAQGLLELIQPQIRSGELPRSTNAASSDDPAFPPPERTISFRCSAWHDKPEIQTYANGIVVPPAR